MNLWPQRPRREPVADPALLDKLCEQAVQIATLEAVIADMRRHPRGNGGRFVSRQDVTTHRLRSELAASNNAELDAALREGRAGE